MCEPAEFYSESFPRSKVARSCPECRREIKAGDQYWRYSGKWEGEFFEHLTCAQCRWIVHAMGRIDSDFCFEAFNLRQTLIDGADWNGGDLAQAANQFVHIMNTKGATE